MHYKHMKTDDLQIQAAEIKRDIDRMEERRLWLTENAKRDLLNKKAILKELKREIKKRFLQLPIDGF